MNCIFHYVDPVLLFKKLPPYQYLFFVLYKPENEVFLKDFRSSMGRYHEDSGKDIGLFVFDCPSERWLRRNLEYFIHRHQDSCLHPDWAYVMGEVKKSVNEKVSWLKLINERSLQSDLYMNRLMEILHITDEQLPALVIFSRDTPEKYVGAYGISIGRLDALLNLCTEKGYTFDAGLIKSLPAGMDVHKIVAMLNDGKSHEYWDIVDAIYCYQRQKAAEREKLPRIFKLFPEFAELKYPDKFEWHRDILKWLRLYRSEVGRLVKQLNTLIEDRHSNSLGLEQIHNFWRFKVSLKYRCHYFEKRGKYVCYFMGFHDYEL